MKERTRQQSIQSVIPVKRNLKDLWIPFAKQEEYIELPFSVREGFFGGSVGTGKTALTTRLPIIYKFHEHPMFKGIILRRKLKDFERELVPRCKQYYGTNGKVGLKATYNENKGRFTFPSGAMIFVGHCQHDDDIERYDGDEYNFIAFEEIQHFNERPYLYLTITRGRSATPDLPVIIRNTGMPGGEGHGWVKKRFVDPAPDGGKLIKDRKTGSSRIFISAKPYDNPHLIRNNPNYYNELQGLSEVDRRAKLGDWNAYAGQVFTEFREFPLPDEPINACHVIDDDIKLDKSWPTIVVGDIGTTALTYFLFLVITPNGQVVADREYAVNGGAEKYPDLPQNTDIAVWASDIGQISRQYSLIDIVLDSTAFEARPEGVTINEIFHRHSGLNARRADKGQNSRIQGRMTVQEYLRWRSKPDFWRPPETELNAEVATKILRNEGQDAYERYLNAFNPPPPETLPKLLMKKRCKLLRDVMTSCIYDGEDIAEFHGDDPIDTLRYGVRAVDFYRESNNRKYQKIKEGIQHSSSGSPIHPKKKVPFGVRRYRHRI